MKHSNNDEIYYVEKILDKRFENSKNEYLIKWKGYDRFVYFFIELNLTNSNFIFIIILAKLKIIA